MSRIKRIRVNICLRLVKNNLQIIRLKSKPKITNIT